MARSNERWKTPLDDHKHHGSPHYRSHAGEFSASHYNEGTVQTPTTVVGIPALPELEGDSPKETTPTELRATPANTLAKSSRPNPVLSPLSPSIYSRNTDGISILPNDSVMSFDGSNDDHQLQDDAGSAVIIASHAIKSYVIGTPSSRHKTDSTRSSKDWRAWLSREVSELSSPLVGDMTIHDGYTPTIRHELPTRHHRELTQIEDDGTTMLLNETTDTNDTVQSDYLSPSQFPDSGLQQPSLLQENLLCNTQTTQGKKMDPIQDDSKKERKVSTLVRSRAIHQDRHSSTRSHHSAPSRSSAHTPRSSTMNDRFPFIDTGRRTSIVSARFNHSSRSGTDSSSSTRSKGTPRSKVYSDLSIPVTVDLAPQSTPQTTLRDKENMKETRFSSTTRTKAPILADPSAAYPSLTKTKNCDAMLSNSSVQLDDHVSLLKQKPDFTVDTSIPSAASVKGAHSFVFSSSPSRQRMRVNMSPVSPTKLITRPKSALELRRKGLLPPTISSISDYTDAAKDDLESKASKSFASRTPDPPRVSAFERSSGVGQDTLRMLLEAPWAITGPPSSPRSSMDGTGRSRIRSKLHTEKSSSTLALHREPSPGLEEQTIDAIIDGRPLSRRSNLVGAYGDERSGVAGRITPGQRMAERYLRDRIAADSGESTLGTETEHGVSRAGPTGTKLEREDTPAFL